VIERRANEERRNTDGLHRGPAGGRSYRCVEIVLRTLRDVAVWGEHPKSDPRRVCGVRLWIVFGRVATFIRRYSNLTTYSTVVDGPCSLRDYGTTVARTNFVKRSFFYLISTAQVTSYAPFAFPA
jgi:hypothetical protein